MATHSVFLAGEFHEKRSLAGYSAWSCKEFAIIEQITQLVSSRTSRTRTSVNLYMDHALSPCSML